MSPGGSVSMEREKYVRELLRSAYKDEMETVMNYQANAIYLDGHEELKTLFEDEVSEELAHARELGERLKQLSDAPPASKEFTPTQDELQLPEDAADVGAVIDGVLAAESDAIELYRELVAAAREAGDPVTEDLAIRLLSDEEAHRTEFEGLKNQYA